MRDGGEFSRWPLGQQLVTGAIILALPVVLLALNVRLLATEAYLRLEFGRPGFPSAPGFTDQERLALAVPSTLFLVQPMTAQDLAALEHDGRPLYTLAEVSHLVDVRRLVRWLMALAEAGLVLLIAGGALWWAGRLRAFPRAVEGGGWLTIGLVVAVGLSIALAWRAFFVTFHRLFFAPGTWQFAAESGLIRLFPERFWFDTVVVMASLALGEGVAVVALGRRLESARRREGARRW